MTARLWWLPSLLLLLTITTLLAGEAATANDRNDSAAAAAAVTGGSGSAVAQTLTAAPISSEQELLNWALAHSNPDALRQAADEARRGAEAGTAEFVERQALLEALKSEPTEAELMKEAVAILSNTSSTVRQLGAALEALRYLVEPIDLANDLHKMNGLAPVVALLSSQQPPELQAAAAFVLGTASSNNREFQLRLMADHPESLSLLLHLLEAGSSGSGDGSSSGGGGAEAAMAQQAAAKALYCLSALLRLSDPARAAFYAGPGVRTLQGVLRQPGRLPHSLSLKRKALGLLADLAQLDVAGAGSAGQGLDAATVVAATVQLLEDEAEPGAAADPDLQEKALLVLLALVDGSAASSPEGASAAVAAAKLIADAGGPATLLRLEDGWQREAAADPGDVYVQDLAALSKRVRGAVEMAMAGAGGSVRGSSHDSTEL